MELSEIAIPAASAVSGGVTVGWIAKTMIQNWLKKHDDMASSVQTMLIQLTRIEERVNTLQRAEERSKDQAQKLAVIESQLGEFKDDLNGVGRKLRALEGQ
jgi:hypothetical protein